jgi:filamentous hemagglutinin family protein
MLGAIVKSFSFQHCKLVGLCVLLLVWGGNAFRVHANPVGGTVTQGAATISPPGPQMTINQTSATAFINWTSFNINAGETTTFNQPSSSSVTWNYINDPKNPSASTINGTLGANGYVVLQNPNGFSIGGQASITAHGLVMTTASAPALNLSSGGPWSFNTPPPAANIINYGQINIAGGGSAFLIANDIVNNGTISAPGGSIGLCAGQTVLVSMSPDGRGLSAKVTLPQGSVDNEGNLIADAGSIVAQAQLVNQNGLVQANSARSVNGTIELVAGNTLNLNANSAISARGDTQGTSPGGSVTIQSGNSFSDQSGSVINVAGGTQGGNSGQVAISAPQMTALNSSIGGQAIAGYADGSISINTADISLNGAGSPVAGALALNVNSLSSGFSQINLQAADSIEVSSQLTLANPGTVSLLAGNTITVDPGAGIQANAGKIVLNATTVNQNGALQANSIGNANGVVEIDAAASLNLGASSVISANGDSTAATASPGGFVVLNAGNNTFADTSGSAISVSGQSGGQNGIVEIFGNGVSAGSIQSSYGIPYALLINPYDLTLSPGATVIAANPTLNFGALASYSQIDLQALDNITLGAAWTLADQAAPTTLGLSAGNNVTLNGTLSAGNNWNVNLNAGTAFTGATKPVAGSDGIYVNGDLQTKNGGITLDAVNEVIVGDAVRTIGGGNIDVTTEFGNVNSGTSANGFNYFPIGTGSANAPYYTPFQIAGIGLQQFVNFNVSSLGGISTAAGGNVTINAGGNVISFPTTTVAAGDPGTGAFGPEAGNVTINAGGNVYGHYVLMNGVGAINAGQNIGTAANNVALSLAKGSWNLDAQGNIYLQEVRNPNGVFNNTFQITRIKPVPPSAGNHLFDYDPQASVTLTAGNGVYVTGYNLPRPNGAVPLVMPSTVIFNAGLGGVVLQTPNALADNNNTAVPLSDYDITLFPSPYGNLAINDGGNFSSGNANGTTASLLMSDSAQTHWFISNSGTQPFSETDHAGNPAEMNNPEPVVLNIAGNMDNVTLQVSKLAQISVGGDMIGCAFFGENLQAADVTSLTVGGQIYNAGSFTFQQLAQDFPSLPADDLPLGDASSLFQILELAVNPAVISTLSGNGIQPGQLTSYYLSHASIFQSLSLSGISYNPNTETLTAIGPLSGGVLTALEEPTLTVVRYGPNGYPLLDANGHFVTDTIAWTPANSANYNDLQSLSTRSQGAPALGVGNGAYVVGGTGTFDVTANSISLGNSVGILSVGDGGGSFQPLGRDYSFLAHHIASGATINVTVLGQQQTVNGQMESSLFMPASAIAALGGGDVNVTAPNGSMDLGDQDLAAFVGEIMYVTHLGLGVYSTGGGNVNVTALGTINIQTSRIAAFNGGAVAVTSKTGDVNAGSGGSSFSVPVHVFSPDGTSFGEQVYANGIVAETLIDPSKVPGGATVPGDITVWTPQGDINADQGGIKQETLNGTAPAGPIVTLTAGTPAVPGDFNSAVPPLYLGDITLGTVGVIGESVIAQATGQITGLAVSRHNTTITSQTVGSLTVLAGGTANVTVQSSSGNGAGVTIIGGQGVNANGVGSGAALLGQNVSANGTAATSTLGTSATATAASSSAAGQTSSETQQQVASNDNGNDDEKKKKKESGLARSVGRVTVVLPKAS